MKTRELIKELRYAMESRDKLAVLEFCRTLRSGAHSSAFLATGQTLKKWNEHLTNIEINAKHPKQYELKARSSVLALADGLTEDR